ncbi:helicase [Aureococcus anophagefferens]|nr:helicase [Aureococcus anophagefferens]
MSKGKGKKKSGKKAPALTLRRACATYEGSVEGCVFTTKARAAAARADVSDAEEEAAAAAAEDADDDDEPAAEDADDDGEPAAEDADDDDEPAAAEDDELTGKPAWSALGLHAALVDAVGELGWAKPTRIQKAAIPVALSGRDVIGLAETGSGKTGAFGLPILHKLLEKPSRLFGVALAPTRELAVQIHEVFDALGAAIGLRCVCVVGGVEIAAQALALAKLPHVVVATPGRLVDHLENTKGFSLRTCKCLVMDEADRMLSMDFEKELDAIVGAIPREGRCSMLFSATMTSKVAKLQRASLYKPVKVAVNDKFAMPRQLDQRYLFVPAKHKECYLAAVLDARRGATALVFCATCAGATRATLLLRNLGFDAACLHGQMAQPKRLGALHKFKAGAATVLVATDVAARGLDIPAVDLVLNYDVPTHGKEYVHRVGRTARAGRKGSAIAFVTQYDVELYQRLEHLIGVKLPKADVDEDMALAFLDRVNDAARLAAGAMRETEEVRKQRRGGGDDSTPTTTTATTTGAADGKRHKFAGMRKKGRGGGRGGAAAAAGPRPRRQGQGRQGKRASTRFWARTALATPFIKPRSRAGDARVAGADARAAGADARAAGARRARGAASGRRGAPGRSGRVIWFNDKKFQGFVKPDAGGDDLFVHGGDVREPIAAGDRVLFEIARFRGRDKCVDVVKAGAPDAAARRRRFRAGARASCGARRARAVPRAPARARRRARDGARAARGARGRRPAASAAAAPRPSPAPARPPPPPARPAPAPCRRLADAVARYAPAAPRPAPAAHYAVIVDQSGSMATKDCVDAYGLKVTRLAAAYDTLLSDFIAPTAQAAPPGKRIDVSLVTMSTAAEVVFQRAPLAVAATLIRRHAAVAVAGGHGNYLPAIDAAETLFRAAEDAAGSHAPPRRRAVDERIPRFASNFLGIGGAAGEFEVLEQVSASLKRATADRSALDSSSLSASLSSMATTMMSSVLETSTAADRAKRTLRDVAREAPGAGYRSRAARRVASPGAGGRLDLSLPFLSPEQRKRFEDEQITEECFDLLDDEELADVLLGDPQAIRAFRLRFRGPSAAGDAGDDVADAGDAPAEEEIEEFLDQQDGWRVSAPVGERFAWDLRRDALVRRDLASPVCLAMRRAYFSKGAERLAYRGCVIDPAAGSGDVGVWDGDDGRILEKLVFKESLFEEEHVVVVRGGAASDDDDDDDDDDLFSVIAGLRGAAKAKALRQFKQKAEAERKKADEAAMEHMGFHVAFCRSQARSAHFASTFNAAVARWPLVPCVEFVEPQVYEFRYNEGAGQVSETTRVLGEPDLGDDYHKFNNNAGRMADFASSNLDCGPVREVKRRAAASLAGLGSIVEEDEDEDEEEDDDEPERLTAGMVPGAFTHYSYEASDGEFMVCDLQGVFDAAGRRFRLTDPCVLSKVGREASGLGRTDRGVVGIVDFFATHARRFVQVPRAATRERQQELVVEDAQRRKAKRDGARDAERQRGRQVNAEKLAREAKEYESIKAKAARGERLTGREKKIMKRTDGAQAEANSEFDAILAEHKEALGPQQGFASRLLNMAKGALGPRLGASASAEEKKSEADDAEEEEEEETKQADTAPRGQMKIFVRCSNGRTFELDVELSDAGAPVRRARRHEFQEAGDAELRDGARPSAPAPPAPAAPRPEGLGLPS